MAGNTWGQAFTVTSFGESHGPAIGCVVDGCPPGIAIDEALLQTSTTSRRTRPREPARGTQHLGR